MQASKKINYRIVIMMLTLTVKLKMEVLKQISFGILRTGYSNKYFERNYTNAQGH